VAGIETEHRGIKVRYSDNEDTWYCSELSFSHASLRRVKARIDKWWKDARSKAAIDVYRIGTDGTIRPAQVVEYLGLKGSYHRNRPLVAVLSSYGRTDKPTRSEVNLDELALISPEIEAARVRLETLKQQKRDIDEQITQTVQGLTRLTVEDIPELVKLRENPEPDELEAISPGRPAQGPL
jgi:hypothetical protein